MAKRDKEEFGEKQTFKEAILGEWVPETMEAIRGEIEKMDKDSDAITNVAAAALFIGLRIALALERIGDSLEDAEFNRNIE